MALRVRDYKVTFQLQESLTTNVWPHPFVKVRCPISSIFVEIRSSGKEAKAAQKEKRACSLVERALERIANDLVWQEKVRLGVAADDCGYAILAYSMGSFSTPESSTRSHYS